MIKGKSTPTTIPEVIRKTGSATASEGRSAFLHFITGDGREFGFPYAQILEFVLDANPEFEANLAAPPQRLLIAFPSRDVTLMGYRLHLLCERLDQQNIARLKTEDTRFAHLHPNQPLIASIAIVHYRDMVPDQ